MKKVVVQKIKKDYASSMELGMKYYSILSVLNDLNLTNKEIQLLAFTAVRGNISSGGAKEQFVEQFNSSKASIGNLIGNLKKLHLLEKREGQIKLNKKIELDFNNNLILNLSLNSTHDPKTK